MAIANEEKLAEVIYYVWYEKKADAIIFSNLVLLDQVVQALCKNSPEDVRSWYEAQISIKTERCYEKKKFFFSVNKNSLQG